MTPDRPALTGRRRTTGRPRPLAVVPAAVAAGAVVPGAVVPGAVVPAAPARPLRRPAPPTRLPAVARRRAADAAVHVGAIVLVLSTLLSPLGTAAAAGCAPACGVTDTEAAGPDPGSPSEAPGATYPTPAGAAPAESAGAVGAGSVDATPSGLSVGAAAAAVVPAPGAPAVTAPAVAAPALTAPTATGPTATTPTATAPTTTTSAPSLPSAPIGTPPATTPATTPSPTTPAPTTPPPTPAMTPPTTTTPSPGPTTTPAPPGDGVTAAATRNWGTPTRTEEFTGTLAAWSLYDGPGHAGNGRRSPAAASVADGVLTLSGDAAGTTAGMAWTPGARYGRWEARVRAPAADPSYHAVMLLWPDAENWPVGGEVDVMEMSDPTRATTDAFLHYGAADAQLHGSVAVDATQWHNWAVEWTPDHITMFLDGVPWWTTSDRAALPPGPMHLCLQLDWFPTGRAVTPSTMQVDRVRYYAYG